MTGHSESRKWGFVTPQRDVFPDRSQRCRSLGPEVWGSDFLKGFHFDTKDDSRRESRYSSVERHDAGQYAPLVT